MKPVIENIQFEIVLNTNAFTVEDLTPMMGSQSLEIISKPKPQILYEILYYLSLGFYDRRGWKYKVKILK